MITLKNDFITAEIDTLGAELKSITVDGEAKLWSGDPAFWEGHAPVLFPICGGLKDDKYTFEGKEYTLEKHGFASNIEFTVEKQTDISAVFLLKSSEETLKSYPWSFELRITYTLRGRSIKISYDVKNTSEKAMYMSIGAHEAYACPEGIEDYDIIFEKKEALNAYNLDGNLLAHSTYPIIKDTDTLPLYEKYFSVDALVFKDLKSRSATLRNRKNGKAVTVDFDGFDYFLIWTKPGAGYVCLEPWAGIPAMNDTGYDITEKEGINRVEPNTVFSLIHTLHL